MLIAYILNFVEERRGNAARLAKETGIALTNISHLQNENRPLPSIERLVILTRAVQILEKNQH
ncbi:hypothetical protein LEP1GSC161_0276 [Leptospira santarosai str. CBC1416]|uniref:DNA-binding helix-turn-helix protein n=1 Tax=Leptospira santarosai str. CBC1416 TaxID=1193059 RepID=M6W3C6_9LEPT|nr:hypothetical protein LEP1GSC161_0276 [Leptospira santarosai str. CBC1416]